MLNLLQIGLGPFGKEGSRTEGDPNWAWLRVGHVANTGPTQPIVVLCAIFKSRTNIGRGGHRKRVTPARRESPADAIEDEKSLFQDWGLEIFNTHVKPVLFEGTPSRER